MNGNTHSASDLSTPPLTFSTLWQRLMRRKILLGLMLLAGLLLAGLLTQMTIPAYRAVAALQIKPRNVQAVNTLVNTFTLNTPEKDLRSTIHNKTLLQHGLEKAKQRLTNSETALASYEQDNGLTEAAADQPEHKKKLAALNKSLLNAERRKSEVEGQLKQLRDNTEESSVLQTPLLAGMKQQLKSLEAKYAQQLEIFKPAYPGMQERADDISVLKRKISAETTRLTRSIEKDHAAAVKQAGRLRSELAAFKAELAELSDKANERDVLQREVYADNKLYTDLQQQINESGVTATSAAADTGSGKLMAVDKAVLPETAFWPDKWLNLLLGGLIGLLLGVILALWRESRQKPIESGRALQAISGLPVLGNIPEVAKKDRQILPLTVVRQVGSPVAEAYRIAAANLKFVNPQGMPRSLLLTSLNPGEGKSTSSVSLAFSLAQLGHKVLLIDADLRRPTLHEKTGLNNHVGLTEYLRGDMELARATQRLQGVNSAFVITAGMLNLDPVEALSSAKMKKLITMAAQYFDITLIDAPPLTGFADSLLLAEMTDATLLVSSESHQLDRGSLGDMVGQIQRVKHNVLGWLIVKARHNVVTEDYYARYGETRRASIDTRLITPLDLRKKGLNLTKGG